MVGWKKRNGRTGSPFFLSQPQSDFKDRASSHLPFAYIKQHKYIYNTILESESGGKNREKNHRFVWSIFNSQKNFTLTTRIIHRIRDTYWSVVGRGKVASSTFEGRRRLETEARKVKRSDGRRRGAGQGRREEEEEEENFHSGVGQSILSHRSRTKEPDHSIRDKRGRERSVSTYTPVSLPLSLPTKWASRSRYRGPRCTTVPLSPHSLRDSTEGTRAYLADTRSSFFGNRSIIESISSFSFPSLIFLFFLSLRRKEEEVLEGSLHNFLLIISRKWWNRAIWEFDPPVRISKYSREILEKVRGKEREKGRIQKFSLPVYIYIYIYLVWIFICHSIDLRPIFIFSSNRSFS